MRLCIAAAISCQWKTLFVNLFYLIRTNLVFGKTVLRPHRVCATGCPPACLCCTARPALALVQRAERCVYLPKDTGSLVTGGRAQSIQTQKCLSVCRWEHPLHRRRRCAHRGTGCCAHFAASSPQHMRRCIPTTIACMTSGRGSQP